MAPSTVRDHWGHWLSSSWKQRPQLTSRDSGFQFLVFQLITLQKRKKSLKIYPQSLLYFHVSLR